MLYRLAPTQAKAWRQSGDTAQPKIYAVLRPILRDLGQNSSPENASRI